MDDFEIIHVSSHARLGPTPDAPLVQWCEVSLSLPKDFDFAKRGAALLKRLQAAAELIGKGD